jgi:hypothetical protein
VWFERPIVSRQYDGFAVTDDSEVAVPADSDVLGVLRL